MPLPTEHILILSSYLCLGLTYIHSPYSSKTIFSLFLSPHLQKPRQSHFLYPTQLTNSTRESFFWLTVFQLIEISLF